jgi:hypothetical protein
MDRTNLTSEQAFLAMYAYLSEIYERSRSDEIGLILSDMSRLPDGSTADSAAAAAWDRSVRKALDGIVDANLRLRK